MWSPQNHADCLQPEQQDRPAAEVRTNPTNNVAVEIVRHVPSLNAAGKARIARLVQAAAWTEAALALIEIEQPQWKLRRLVYDDGQWLCSLSRQLRIPIENDDVAECRHPALPLAILGALAETKRYRTLASECRLSSVPRDRPATGTPVCCDNFT